MAVYRVFVEKKPEYAVEAQALFQELQELLDLKTLKNLRIINRYDVEGIEQALFKRAFPIVFSEPQLDHCGEDFTLQSDEQAFALEYLPGQYDQRAASCAECLQLLGQCERPTVYSAKIYVLKGALSSTDLDRVKAYVLNPVDSREASMELEESLVRPFSPPEDVKILEGFRDLDAKGRSQLAGDYGLAMDENDLSFCQGYFQAEGRDPSLTELRLLDTYWSDHCRHTTFLTELHQVTIEDPKIKAAYERYLKLRQEVYDGRRPKPVSLMDMATIGAKALKKRGLIANLDESEEINACSVKVKAKIDGREEPWLLLFKNETHNHPTEIEPFGGAATCIGGAIRDPLSGRAYVYQAMRVTGAGNPLKSISETLKGKLPQRKICVTAAAGFSSYGNQIGLATGLVEEYYHPGYEAKRLELGAVLGAVPEKQVRRESPAPGDLVVLLGGRTGRDGCGGATGSSKSHETSSLASCGAEVQKGNAPEERKLQRLFRNPDASLCIKRCNDFGAGGVAVAIGELADGLVIDLDRVPKKYEGLDGTELAISESQERMAVILAPEDLDKFLALAAEENLEATAVARVTREKTLVMRWQGKEIVRLERSFLNSNGAPREAEALIPIQSRHTPASSDLSLEERLKALLSDLNACSKQGLCERFDSTIGAASVLMPFGGLYQKTPAQSMVAKFPVLKGETSTVSGMASGFHPDWLMRNPYEGAYQAVVYSLCKLCASGFERENAYLTFQEYFEKLRREPLRWGKPLAALLGALDAQMALQIASIGGKDSMSGSFEQLDVPPTLVSFAVASGDLSKMISPEFKQAGNCVSCFKCDVWDAKALQSGLERLKTLNHQQKLKACYAVGEGGIAEALFKMGLGNRVGLSLTDEGLQSLFTGSVGCFVVESSHEIPGFSLLGHTLAAYRWEAPNMTLDLGNIEKAYEGKLQKVFPFKTSDSGLAPRAKSAEPKLLKAAAPVAKPRALIPVFPGTNCEYDTLRALERAGALPETLVIRNLSPQEISRSVLQAYERLSKSQMLILPGGFSGGDEPEGSAKFITAFLRNPAVTEAVHRLLESQDGLILGICNGFQALIKSGLIEHGRIMDCGAESPTLTFNRIGRHQSMLVRTGVSSTLSPWFSKMRIGDKHTIAISHGEGRFVAPLSQLETLNERGQIAAQYVDLEGHPSLDSAFNPNGSLMAVEALSSPDGRVLGKMGHSERAGEGLYLNVPGNKYQPLFEGGVHYYR